MPPGKQRGEVLCAAPDERTQQEEERDPDEEQYRYELENRRGSYPYVVESRDHHRPDQPDSDPA
jgi:hypothetical protein